jgi:membrane protease YdiL (CAAX protease family)
MSEPREVARRTDDGGRPWGLWATVGFSVLILALWLAGQEFAIQMLAGRGARASAALAQGWIFAWMIIIAAPIVVGTSLILARLRHGMVVEAYLGLTWPSARQALRWSLILVGLLAASDSLSLALGRSLVPESMVPLFRTTGFLPIFLLALVVVGPLAEEFLFRGFLFTGLLHSRLGPTGAIALTALTWGSLHLQYDLYGMATVVGSGIFLGLLRWRTGSLWLCVLLHGFMNIVATLEVLFVLSRR